MTIRLSLRKRFRKLIVNSKGFSSVIGTTFMVLVMMFLSTAVFMWTLSQNTVYNEAVRARNQEEADRSNENVVALSGNYSVTAANNVTVHVVLKNVGSVPVQIVNLWVLDSDNRGYMNKSLDLNMAPGEVLSFVGSDELTVTIPGAEGNHTFASWFVTARGNTIPLEKELGVIVAQLAQGIGSIALDFYTFRHYLYETNPPNKLKDYPMGNVSFSVRENVDVAFGVVITNLDPSKKSISLDKYSQLWLYFPAVPGVPPFVWYVVSESNGIISSSYSEISVPYGESKLLIFASAKAGNFSSSTKVQITHGQLKGEDLGAVNLLLHGKLGSGDYAQNIPFVSLFCHG